MHDLKRLAVSVLLVSIALAGCNRTGDQDAKQDKAATADATACANTILAWSGVGATFGGMGGSFISVLGGWAIGGGLAAQYSRSCNITR